MMFHSIAARQKLLSEISSSAVICTKSLAYEKDVWVCNIWASYFYVNLTTECSAQPLQSCPTLCDPMDWSPPGSSVHGILQERLLEWAAIPFSRRSSPPSVWTRLSYIAGRFFFFFPFICISWRLITLQYCSGFCHTLTWISHGFTCVPHPHPPSHLPLYPIPLGLPSAPGPSICLMHPAWAGDLFHPR